MKKLIIVGLFTVVFVGCKSQNGTRLDNVENRLNAIESRLEKTDLIQLAESKLLLEEAIAINRLNNKCNIK